MNIQRFEARAGTLPCILAILGTDADPEGRLFQPTAEEQGRYTLPRRPQNGRIDRSSMMKRARYAVALMMIMGVAACHQNEQYEVPGAAPLPDASYPPVPANIILISVDTLRPDRLGCYGNEAPSSPEIDRFRNDAVLFSNAIAQAPSTLPSHASLFTSLLPSQHGASWGLSTPLSEEVQTIAEVLKDAGYETAAFTGGGQLSATYGVAQGFTRYEEPHGEDRLSTAVDTAVEWLSSVQSQRFFLFLHTYETHHPYTPDPAFLSQVEPSYEGRLPPKISKELLQRINSGEEQLQEGDLEHILACYDAEIRSMDAGFGELVTYLNESGIYDETLIIFTSDHGEEFNEHGVVGWHSHTLYDELLRIPLLVKLPGALAAGTRIDAQVRLIDVAPTITETLGLPPVEQFSGSDLRRLIQAPPQQGFLAISQQDSDRGFLSHSIRTRRWKLLPSVLFNRTTLRGESFWKRAVTRANGWWRPYRLLDLENDPLESDDVGVAHRSIRSALREELETGLSSRPRHSAPPVTVDQETEDKLRALGYLE